MSRRVHGHGDRPTQCSGVHTLEAVASAQRRFVSQRNPGKKSPMDGRYEDVVTRREWMRCCACKLRDEDTLDQPAGAGTRLIDGVEDTGGLGLGHRRGGNYSRLL